MYGSVARARLKEGTTDAQLKELIDTMQTDRPAGAAALLVYRSTDDRNELWICGAFESEEAYRNNARTPEQNARFERMVAILDGPPQWHDGDVLAVVATDKVRTPA
jgi:quinol monooxygenase YgiN